MDEHKEEPMTPESVLAGLEPLSGVLKQTVSTIWGIFVRRYVAKGLSFLVAAFAVVFVSIRLLGTETPWLFLPAVPVLVLLLDSIQLLVNPQYFAMEDVLRKVNEEKTMQCACGRSVSMGKY